MAHHAHHLTPLSIFPLLASFFLLLSTAPALADDLPPQDLIVSGTLRTENNQPLPQPPIISLQIISQSKQFGSSGNYDVDNFGNFKQALYRGNITIDVKVPGYAPLIVGPLSPNADNSLPILDLVLTKGFPAAIRLTDPDGKAIPHAHAVLSYQREDKNYFCCPESFTTDAAGTIQVPNAIDRAAQLEVNIPGFQYDILPLQLNPDAPAALQLKPAFPATGTIVDSNNKPVAKATIALLHRKGFHDQFWFPESSKSSDTSLATTDLNGHFALTSLRDDSTYAILVSAPGCATQFIEDIKAGNDLNVTLLPAKTIEVEIHTAPGKKPPGNISVSYDIHLQNSGRCASSSSLLVKTKEGVGRVTIKDPLPAPYKFYDNAGHSVTVDPTTDFTNPIVLDLPTTPPADAP